MGRIVSQIKMQRIVEYNIKDSILVEIFNSPISEIDHRQVSQLFTKALYFHCQSLISTDSLRD